MNRLRFNSFNKRRVLKRYDDVTFDTAKTKLRYRETGETNWINVEGSAMNVPDTNRVVHTVNLNGLTPDTKYEFQLSTSFETARYLTWKGNPSTSIVVHWHTLKPFTKDYSNGFADKVMYFKTAPLILSGDINFVQISDTHGGARNHDIFENIAEKDNIAGIIHSGDMATGNGGLAGPKTWYTFFDALNKAVNSDGTIIPILPNLGNHEIYNGYSGTHWWKEEHIGKKPDFENGIRADSEWYYCFFPSFLEQGYSVHKFGNYLSIYQLDVVTTKLDEGQDLWLSETLEEDSNSHKLISLHYSPYTAGRRSQNTNYIKDVREILVPIWENHKPLVMVGHEHVLSKTVPIKNNQIDEEGAVYIGSGPSGNRDRSGLNPHTKWWLEFSKASEWKYYEFEMTTGTDDYREPHPEDGREFTFEEVNNWWHIRISNKSRTMTAYDLNKDDVYSFTQVV